MTIRKKDFTPADYRYARYTYNRLRHEYGNGLTSNQLGKEIDLPPHRASQRINHWGFRQYKMGRYHVDDVTAFMTRWHRDKLDKLKPKKIKSLKEVQ